MEASRALELATARADPLLEARAALALANSRSREDDPIAARQLLERALERALAADDLALAAEVCAALSNSYYWTGELGSAWRHGARRLQLAERGADIFSLRHGHSWLAPLAFSRGEWAEARRLLELTEPALLRLASPEPIAFVRVVQGLVAYRVGELGEAHDRLEEALGLLSQADFATVVWYAGLPALVSIERGDLEAAERALAGQEARLPAAALPARSARAVLGLTYAALGDRRRGAECEAALRPHADDFHWWPARRTLAALAALRGDQQTALADLDQMETRCRREQLLPDLALGLLLRAQLRDRTEDFSQARRLLEQLGMRRDLERADKLGTSGEAPFGRLTAREVQVLRLVAEGMTNREIGAALFVSEHTVVNHLSHIFAKLGVENRAGATAYALRTGIA